ncbi:MAG: LamG domain-containing protein, partial [Spirochaetota bacterium]
TINNVFVGYGTNTSHNSFNLGMRAVTGGAIVTIGVTNSLTSSNLTIDLNTWTHTCGTYDGTKARIYVNGHLTQETTVSSWNTILSGNLYIGRGSGPDTNTLFTGKVADVRIYNRALNDSEINMLAENGEATGMVAYLPFDNGSTDEKGPTGLSLLTTGGSPSNTTGKDGDTDGAKNLGDTIYYDYETTGLPTGSNAHTYCAWGKINSLNTKDRLTRFGTGSPGQTVGLTLSDNGTKVGYSSWGDNVEYTTPVTVPTGEWVHLCGKYDGTTASLYYNGKPVASAAKTWDIVNSVFRISANSADGFIGSVDDVRIYNNALSDSQIRYLAIRVPHGLTYYLDFTGDTNDISGFAQNASNSGATATTDRFGEANSAYSFTGSETITTALADLQRGIPIESNRRTICFRFTISSTPTAGSSYSLFSYGVSSSFNNVIMRYVKNGSGINKIQFNAVSSGQNIDYTVPIATWTHVCGVYSNHNPKIYVNGTLQTLSSSNAGVWNTVLDSIILGQDHQGKLDDVQIYNRTLSASEIQAVYGQ